MTKDDPMTKDDIEIQECRTVFQGYFRVDRYALKHRRFDGDWSGQITREVFERGHAAAVLPYDPVTDQVVLIEQFRVGALATGRHPWLIECAAGIIDEGEAPEDVARREAVEEMGCPLTRVEPVMSVIHSPGGSSETCRLYVGQIDATKAGGVHGLPDEAEDIKSHVLSFDTAMAWLEDGRIDNSTTVIALLWLARHRPALRQRWLEAP
jgi:ADP-ribose pyrophosphatase